MGCKDPRGGQANRTESGNGKVAATGVVRLHGRVRGGSHGSNYWRRKARLSENDLAPHKGRREQHTYLLKEGERCDQRHRCHRNGSRGGEVKDGRNRGGVTRKNRHEKERKKGVEKRTSTSGILSSWWG